MRRWVSLVAATLVLLSSSGIGASQVVGDQVVMDAQQGLTSEPSVSVDAERVGATNQLTYEFRLSSFDDVEGLSLVVGRNVEVTTADGFRVQSDDGRTRLVLEDGVDSARVEITSRTTASDGRESGEYFATSTWMLGRVPFVELRWRPVGSERLQRVRPLGDRYGALDDDPAGTYGDRYALVGEQTVLTHRANGQQFRIATPDESHIGPATDEILSSLATASRQLQVGDRDERLTLFAVPDPARSGGESFPARDEAWVNAGSTLDSPNNVWIHEYVHTRQEFRLGEDMEWFREASAEYYAARLTYEQGRISDRELTQHFAGPQYERTRLADRGTWEDARVPYVKGARVLAVLDQNIRESTDGERSLQDVFRRMNEHDGRVTYTDFRAIVSDVAGTSMHAWLDRYVQDTGSLNGVFENRPARAGLTAQSFGVTSPGLTFLGVSLVFSALASMPLYAVLRRFERDGDGGPPLFVRQRGH
jgi:hypothetical protein